MEILIQNNEFDFKICFERTEANSIVKNKKSELETEGTVKAEGNQRGNRVGLVYVFL